MNDLSRRQAAVVACVSCFVTIAGAVIGVAAPDGNGADAGVAVFGWCVVVVSDVVRAWALLAYFRRVHESLALLGLLFMLLHDAVFAASLPLLVVAPHAPAELSSTLLSLQTSAFHIGLLFFSGHLLVNGALALKDKDVPRVVGVLVVVAGVGYVVDSGVRVFAGVTPSWLSALALPNTVGELALAIWLGARGGRRG